MCNKFVRLRNTAQSAYASAERDYNAVINPQMLVEVYLPSHNNYWVRFIYFFLFRSPDLNRNAANSV